MATIFNALRLASILPCGNKASCETLAETNNIADEFLQAATHAPHPMQAAASNALSASILLTRLALASGA